MLTMAGGKSGELELAHIQTRRPRDALTHRKVFDYLNTDCDSDLSVSVFPWPFSASQRPGMIAMRERQAGEFAASSFAKLVDRKPGYRN